MDPELDRDPRYGSGDPDPHQTVTAPQHWAQPAQKHMKLV